jgi:hypothetical protein
MRWIGVSVSGEGTQRAAAGGCVCSGRTAATWKNGPRVPVTRRLFYNLFIEQLPAAAELGDHWSSLKEKKLVRLKKEAGARGPHFGQDPCVRLLDTESPRWYPILSTLLIAPVDLMVARGRWDGGGVWPTARPRASEPAVSPGRWGVQEPSYPRSAAWSVNWQLPPPWIDQPPGGASWGRPRALHLSLAAAGHDHQYTSARAR